MKIAFDCRSVFPGMGGIGRATACLARELPQALREHQLLFLLGARRPPFPLTNAPNAQEVPTEAAMIDPEFEQIRLPGLLTELGADLYHGTCFSVPLGAPHVRRVATVHDVVFRRRPDLVDEGLRDYLDRWTDVSCEVADAVVTVSEFSKREITELYHCKSERVHVVPNAVDESFFRIERRTRHGSPPYVLYVGSIERKKNVLALLAGFAALIRREKSLPHHLVLVGGAGGAAFDLEQAVDCVPQIRDRIHALGHVPDDHLRGLYGGADAFAYLSEYEGFGLPPLEALAAGVPTVVSNLSSLPEVTGDGALAVDPHDPDKVADAIKTLLTDSTTSGDLVRKGFLAARRFSWSASARALANLYERVVNAPKLQVLAGGKA